MHSNSFLRYRLIAMLWGGIIVFSSCSKNDNTEEAVSYAGNFLFDQKELILERTESNAIVKILGVEGFEDYVVPKTKHAWGAARVRLIESEEISTVYDNTFKITVLDDNTKFNEYLNPFRGAFFSIENIDGDVHIRLNENTEAERKLVIEINGGLNGYGEIFVTQKGI